MKGVFTPLQIPSERPWYPERSDREELSSLEKWIAWRQLEADVRRSVELGRPIRVERIA